MFRRGNPVYFGRLSLWQVDRHRLHLRDDDGRLWSFAMTKGALASHDAQRKQMAGRDHDRPWPLLCVSRAGDL